MNDLKSMRPLSGWVGLTKTGLGNCDRAVVSVHGVRGIGSIDCLSYAGSHWEFMNKAQLWSLVGLVIPLSTILHGFSVGPAMDRMTDKQLGNLCWISVDCWVQRSTRRSEVVFHPGAKDTGLGCGSTHQQVRC